MTIWFEALPFIVLFMNQVNVNVTTVGKRIYLIFSLHVIRLQYLNTDFE